MNIILRNRRDGRPRLPRRQTLLPAYVPIGLHDGGPGGSSPSVSFPRVFRSIFKIQIQNQRLVVRFVFAVHTTASRLQIYDYGQNGPNRSCSIRLRSRLTMDVYVMSSSFRGRHTVADVSKPQRPCALNTMPTNHPKVGTKRENGSILKKNFSPDRNSTPGHT